MAFGTIELTANPTFSGTPDTSEVTYSWRVIGSALLSSTSGATTTLTAQNISEIENVVWVYLNVRYGNIEKTAAKKITVAPKGNETYSTIASYKVRHWLESVEGRYTVEDTETFYGTVGTYTSATAKTFVGFTARTIHQEVITPDGLTDVSISYERNKITLTLNLDGGSGTESLTGKYGTNVTAPSNPTKTGYTFAGWSPALPDTYPAENAAYTATWTAGTATAYTVKHCLQPLSLSTTLTDYEEKYFDRETGTTGAQTSATAKTLTGFTARPVEQETIAADGSTVVSIYYDRNEITLTLNLDGGSGTESITGKYGTVVTEPRDLTKAGYTFDWWSPSLPGTFPAENATYTAIWKAGTDTAYTVKHCLQPVSLSTTLTDYEEQTSDEESKTGTTGEQTSAKSKNYPGFTAQTITQETIAADGSTVVSVYYDRNEIVLLFDSAGGSEVSSIRGKYGTTVTAPENPTKTGYTFSSWSPTLPETFPENHNTYKATWTKNTLGSITASAPTYTSTVEDFLSVDDTSDSTKITFTAKGNYSSFIWYVDGDVVKEATGSTFTMAIDNYDAGATW